MSSFENIANAELARLLPELYVHKGRVCAYELEHSFAVAHSYASRIIGMLVAHSWVSDPYAHGHGPAGRNHPSYLFSKRRVREDHGAADALFRSTVNPSLQQVLLDTTSSRADMQRGVENPYSSVMYHGGIAVLASEYDLQTRNYWIGGAPGWTAFVDMALLQKQAETSKIMKI